VEQNKFAILAIFLTVYVFLCAAKRFRATAACLGVAAMVLVGWGTFTLSEVFWSVKWNVIGIFAGTLILAELFTESRVPARLADILVMKARSVGNAALLICILSGVISIAVANVATVLIIAPIAVELARRLKVSPVPFLIGIAISSNLQGTATLIGDPPSMILADHERMGFLDFFWYRGRPGIFFAVEIGAALSFLVLYLFYRKYRQPVVAPKLEEVKTWTPTVLLSVMIVALSIVSSYNFSLSGATCMVLAGVGLLFAFHENRREALGVIKRYDFSTTFLMAGIFVLVQGLEEAGILEDISLFMRNIVGTNRFVAFTLVVWFSVLFSAFIDNIPYIIIMLPVVYRLSIEMGMQNDYLLAFGLVLGSCLGGNITHIGASANVVAVGIARRQGYPINLFEFAKIGLPFTIAATLGGYIFVWLTWAGS